MLEVSAGEHTMDRAGLCSWRLSAASFPTYSTRAQWDACTLSCTLSLLRRRKKASKLGLEGAETSLTVPPPQIQKEVLLITGNLSLQKPSKWAR